MCEALGLYPSSSHELEMDGEGWAVCWACPVLFSDDAARCGWQAAGARCSSCCGSLLHASGVTKEEQMPAFTHFRHTALGLRTSNG